MIGNSLGRFINKSQPKGGLYASCARTYVEVDIDKGLLEAINLMLDSWTHVQKLDYEQFTFKCKIFHEYGLFAKDCEANQVLSSPPTTTFGVQIQCLN